MRVAARWIACLAAALVLASGSEADARRWLRADSPSFIVYSDAGESALRRQIANLEAYDAILRALTGAPAERAPARLEVFLLSSAASLRVVKPSDITTRIGGFYEAYPDITAAFVYMEDSWDGGAQHTLFHEYAHHFAMQYFPTAYPIWYGEGFAEYFATTSIRGDRVEVGNFDPMIASGLLSGRWMPLSRLLTEGTTQLNNADAARFYSQSWAFVHYLYSAPENLRAFRAYHTGLLRGEDPIQSFPTHFGKSIEDFEEDLRRYVRGRISYQRFSNPSAQHEEVVIGELPESADDLLLLDARVRGRVPEAEMPALLEQVRTAAAAFPNDAFAQLAWARALSANGEPAAARAALEPFAAASAQNADVQYLRGCTFADEAQASQSAEETDRLMGLARRAFTAAYRADPNHAAALHAYAHASDLSSDNTLNVVLLAHQLRPQVQDFVYSAAYALSAHHRYADAANLLRPLAHDPHGASAQLQEMLADLERQAAQAPSTP